MLINSFIYITEYINVKLFLHILQNLDLSILMSYLIFFQKLHINQEYRLNIFIIIKVKYQDNFIMIRRKYKNNKNQQ